MRLARHLLIVALMALPTVANATERVFMLPLAAEGISTAEQRLLYDRIAGRLTAYKAADIITEDAAQAVMVKSRNRELLGDTCTADNSCLSNLGRLLDSRYIVRTSAVGVGQRIVISIELVDIETGSILSKQEWNVERPLEAASETFEQTMDAVVRPLQKVGSLTVYSEATDSYLGGAGTVQSTGTLGRLSLELPIGTYALELTHPEYIPATERVLVTVGKSTWKPDQITRAEARGPWYAQWWVWTAAAVAIGGGVGTYIALQPVEPQPAPPRLPPYGKIEVTFQ